MYLAIISTRSPIKIDTPDNVTDMTKSLYTLVANRNGIYYTKQLMPNIW